MGDEVSSGLQDAASQKAMQNHMHQICNSSGFCKLKSRTRVCFPDTYVGWRKGQL